MAQSKLISAFLFLVFILSQQIQSIEGRHLRDGKKSIESKTIQTQTKIYETETIKHGRVLHGDDKSNEKITSVSPPTVNVSQALSHLLLQTVASMTSDPPVQVTALVLGIPFKTRAINFLAFLHVHAYICVLIARTVNVFIICIYVY